MLEDSYEHTKEVIQQRDFEANERARTHAANFTLQEQLAVARQEVHLLASSFDSNVQQATSKAVKHSRATMRGQAVEQLVPFLQEAYKPSDMHFVGKPIDYVVFDGLSAAIDGGATLIDQPEIEPWLVLLEVKTNSSQLTKSQRLVRDAVQAGRVKFTTFNADTLKFQEFYAPHKDGIIA